MPRVPKPNSDRRSHHAKPPEPERSERRIKKPILPPLEGAEWHPATLEWWEDAVCGLWASQAGRELIDSDLHGLRRLAQLIQCFHTVSGLREQLALAAEIRILGASFGLDPTSRRRLGWRSDASPKPENPLERWTRQG